MKKIGVLALQGDFEKHIQALERLGNEAIEVRDKRTLESTSALIIPGGESTTLLKLLHVQSFHTDLIKYAMKRPVMGTCAGLIILSENSGDNEHPPLKLVDIDVERNAYGRQRESFIAGISLHVNGKTDPFEGVFIRAPKIKRVGPDIDVIARYGDDIVMAASERILVCTFHPELSGDDRIHRYFLEKFLHLRIPDKH